MMSCKALRAEGLESTDGGSADAGESGFDEAGLFLCPGPLSIVSNEFQLRSLDEVIQDIRARVDC